MSRNPGRLRSPDSAQPPLAAARARVRCGYRNLRQILPVPAGAPKPGKPGPGRPAGPKNRRPATRQDVGKTIKRTDAKIKNQQADRLITSSAAKPDADVNAPSPRVLVNSQFEKGRQLLLDLRYEIAQLDLLASRTVRQAAGDLFEAHQAEATRLLVTAMPGQDDSESREAAQVKIEVLQDALMERTRADLGLGVPVRPGASWASSSRGPANDGSAGVSAAFPVRHGLSLLSPPLCTLGPVEVLEEPWLVIPPPSWRY